MLEDIYAKLARAATVEEQRTLMREYERVALDEQAHLGVTLWWYKINPHRSYVKGWKVASQPLPQPSSSTMSGWTSR